MLSPRDKAGALNVLRHNLPNMRGLSIYPGAVEYLDAELRRLQALAELPVVFRQVGGDDANGISYEIGRGDDLRVVSSRLRGVWAVWCVLDDPGEPFNPADLSRAGARAPVTSVRKMIRKEAAAQFEAWGAMELRAAALTCNTHGDRLHMHLPLNAPRFVTR